MKKQLLLITLLLTTFFSFGQVPTSERDALVALYNSTDGANWTNNTNWNTAEPVSSWFGVTVENIMGIDHITKIEINDNNLNGTLPIEIGNLIELKIFTSVFSTNLIGNIPTEIGNCSKLEQLEFSYCNLSGNIPTSFSNLINMQHLYLGNNQLSGIIPDIFNSMNLKSLEIGKNEFSGDMILTTTNSSFYYIDIQETLLSSFDFRNGYNTNITNPLYFKAENNPNLTCVFVDDATYSATNWTNIDATATFLETQAECDALGVDDETFKPNIELYPNPTSGILHIENNDNIMIKRITISNTLGKKITEKQTVRNIDISNLPNGVYYFNIEIIEGSRASYKIIKE